MTRHEQHISDLIACWRQHHRIYWHWRKQIDGRSYVADLLASSAWRTMRMYVEAMRDTR